MESDWPLVIFSIPAAADLYEVMGSSVMVTHLIQLPTSGGMYIDLLTCILSIVDLRLDPVADDHPVLPIQELSDPED